MQQRPWQTPSTLLILMAIAMPIAFSTWTVLLNNFVVERAGFTGVEIGILQSLREIPGFLAFTTVFVLLILKEQTFAVIALALLGIGVALTGFFPNAIGLYLTTVLMSTGFHYFEVVKQSLALQWFKKADAPRALGKLISVGSITSLVVYATLWVLLAPLGLDYVWLYLLAGGVCCCFAVFMALGFPHFEAEFKQTNSLVLKKRYWLFYALQFFSGARRQIFMVFAAFLMVEKFGYSAAQVTTLFLVNYVFNWLFAERIGGLIGRIGERMALTIEYGGLVIVFTAYAFVENPVRRRRIVCNRSYVLCPGYRDPDVFSEDRKSRRHREFCGRLIYDQSHRRGGYSCGTWTGVDHLALGGIPDRYGIRLLLAAASAEYSLQARRGQRSELGTRSIERLNGRTENH